MIFLHITISIFIILISRILFRFAFGEMRFNRYMPHIHLWLFQLLILSLAGANLMLLGIRGNIIKNFITNENHYLSTIWAVYYIMLMLPISIIIFNHILGFNINNNNRIFINSPTEYSFTDSDRSIKIFFGGMTVVSVVVVIYLCYYEAPLYMYLTGRINRVLSARVAYNRMFKGSQIIKNVIGESIIPLSSYISFSYFKHTKHKHWRMIFYIHLLSSIFIKGAGMSKSGIAWYFLPYIFIITIMDGKIPFKKMVKIALVLIPIPLYMYTLQYTASSLGLKDILFNFYGGPIGRILVGQIQSLPAYFQIFPYQHEYLLGKSISLFRHLGLPFIESARIIATYIEPIGVSSGWVGVANTLFVGDAYANFGLIGLIISPIWVGFVYSLFYSKLTNNPKTPLSIGVYVFILDNLTKSITGGFCCIYYKYKSYYRSYVLYLYQNIC